MQREAVDERAPVPTSDPAHPVELGKWRRDLDSYTNDVKLVEAGGRRYALIADAPVAVVDVTDPASPTLVAMFLESAHTLFTEARGGKQYLYIGSQEGLCPIYDAHQPLELGHGRRRTQDRDARGGELRRAPVRARRGSAVCDVLAATRQLQDARQRLEPQHHGGRERAYFTYYQDGVRVVDVSNPAQPRLVGY